MWLEAQGGNSAAQRPDVESLRQFRWPTSEAGPLCDERAGWTVLGEVPHMRVRSRSSFSKTRLLARRPRLPTTMLA
jgi:hypothetical protein